MLKERFLGFLIVATILCAIATAASAVAVDPAPSWRGSLGSSFQSWGFGDSSETPAPDDVNNPYGTPTAAITVGEFGEGWKDQLPAMGTPTGYWDMGILGTITLNINNSQYNSGYKEIWVHVTYFQDLVEAPTADVSANGIKSPLGTDTQLLEHVSTGGDWYVQVTKWRIEPNPNNETITITSGAMGSIIDSVTVDTLCVPEPSSIIALLMGGSGLLVFRRRRA